MGKRFTQGDTFDPSASMFNRIMGATEAYEKSVKHGVGRINRLNSMPGIIDVKNTAGRDMDVFEIVSIVAPCILSTDNLDEFQFRYSANVTDINKTNYYYKYGILQEPIPNGGMGKCLISGFTACKVRLSKSWHKYARVALDSPATFLESGDHGTAIINWIAATTAGTHWAYVTLKNEISVSFGKAVNAWVKASGDGCYVDVQPCQNHLGADPDTTAANLVRAYLPRLGSTDDPNVLAGAIVPYIVTQPHTTPITALALHSFLDGEIEKSLKMRLLGSSIPGGWAKYTDASQQTVAWNTAPTQTGYNTHGAGTNSHTNHSFSIANHSVPTTCGTGYSGDKSPINTCIAVTHNLGHTVTGLPLIHSESSNWPPYKVIDIIKRIDNSYNAGGGE